MLNSKMSDGQISDNTKLYFEHIMEQEFNLTSNPSTWDPRIKSADLIFHDMRQIMQYVKLGALPRSFYSESYGLTPIELVPESVGSHTLVALAIAGKALEFEYGREHFVTEDKYSRDDILLTMARHDLAETITNDIADDGRCDKSEKFCAESAILREFDDTHPEVNRLFQDMYEELLPTGQELNPYDKCAGIFRVLYEDSIIKYLKRQIATETNPKKSKALKAKLTQLGKNIHPRMDKNHPDASELDKAGMELCDYCEGGKCLASEMWTIRYFKTSKTILLDHSGYTTAILIAATLSVNNHWYNWRSSDYI